MCKYITLQIDQYTRFSVQVTFFNIIKVKYDEINVEIHWKVSICSLVLHHGSSLAVLVNRLRDSGRLYMFKYFEMDF